MGTRRLEVTNIPYEICEALKDDYERGERSLTEIIEGVLVRRYNLEIRFGGGPKRKNHDFACDQIFIKLHDEVYRELKINAARSDTDMTRLIVYALAQHYGLTEHASLERAPRGVYERDRRKEPDQASDPAQVQGV